MNPSDPNPRDIKPGGPVFAVGDQPLPPNPNPQSIYPTPAVPSPPGSKPPDQKSHDGWRSVLSTVGLFLLAPLIALTIAAFVIQSYQVDGQSMETSLQDHDRLIVDKAPRTWARLIHHNFIPHRGDIVIFNQSGLPGAGLTSQKQLIKRVIGLPGERVVVKDGDVTVYNTQKPDGFNPDTSGGFRIAAKFTPGTVDVNLQKDEIFVLGDNRTNSEDSRYFGPVQVNNLVGKLILRLLPLGKLQKF